jgi:transposase
MDRERSAPLPTIWRVPDDLWALVRPVLEVYDPPKRSRGGRWAARGRRGCGERPRYEAARGHVDAVVLPRPAPTPAAPQHLCLDKAYDNPTGRSAVAAHHYVPHIRRIGEEKLDAAGEKRYPARRWVVERTLGWLSKCRALLVRHEKKADNFLGLIQLACALLWYRRYRRLAAI